MFQGPNLYATGGVRHLRDGGGEDAPAWKRHELFPTPPWATRALVETVFPMAKRVSDLAFDRESIVWDPAAGLGHMSDVLAEYSGRVIASDVERHEYEGPAPKVEIDRADYLQTSAATGDRIDVDLSKHRDRKVSQDRQRPEAEWIVTNPPFTLGEAFALHALRQAHKGVALLLRTQWIEGADRYKRLFSVHPPTLLAPFAERVPICAGGYDVGGSSATAYAWFVWMRNIAGLWNGGSWPFPISIIPPGQRAAFFKETDRELALRHVPGWVAPSLKRKQDRQ